MSTWLAGKSSKSMEVDSWEIFHCHVWLPGGYGDEHPKVMKWGWTFSKFCVSNQSNH